MRRIALLTIALALMLPVVLFTASCTNKAVQTQPVSTLEPEVQEAPESTEQEVAMDDLMDRLEEEAAAPEPVETVFVPENIHFAFDSAVLSFQARQILSRMADYLSSNPDVAITVEGHCDDRGTDAYNMALGKRRAEAAKVVLVDLGIGADRLKTVSYGEERPLAAGHSEASWAENRRAQFVIN